MPDWKHMPSSLRQIVMAMAWLGSIFIAAPTLAEPLALSVVKARVTMDTATKSPLLLLELAPESRKAFGAWTARLVGKQITINIDGRPVVSPTIRDPVLGGQLQISGHSTAQEFQDIANRLMAGQSKITADLKAD